MSNYYPDAQIASINYYFDFVAVTGVNRTNATTDATVHADMK